MANKIGDILVGFKADGNKSVEAAFDRLGGRLRNFNRDVSQSVATAKGLRRIGDEFKKLGRTGANSVNSFRSQIAVFEGLRNQADITSREFREFSREIERLTGKMNKATAVSGGFGRKLRGLSRSAATVVGASTVQSVKHFFETSYPRWLCPHHHLRKSRTACCPTPLCSAHAPR